ncbi:MAG: response regulator, partial [SAR86 cluster bacterium]|nr:response regulator [SAR86 cluster bacterium]
MLSHEKFSGRPILFVDDDQRWLKLIERWFEDSSYECVFVNSGKQALAEIDKQSFDVVVSDISMPEVSGIDLMNMVKLKLPNAARIVMSGKMDLVGSIEAINKGRVLRYLVKPCDGKALKLAVYE